MDVLFPGVFAKEELKNSWAECPQILLFRHIYSIKAFWVLDHDILCNDGSGDNDVLLSFSCICLGARRPSPFFRCRHWHGAWSLFLMEGKPASEPHWGPGHVFESGAASSLQFSLFDPCLFCEGVYCESQLIDWLFTFWMHIAIELSPFCKLLRLGGIPFLVCVVLHERYPYWCHGKWSVRFYYGVSAVWAHIFVSW